MEQVDTLNSHILIIDDVAPNLEIARAILRKAGFQVSIAESGSEGLKLLEQTSIDLILLDIMMPGMDGFEVAATVKGMEKYADLPIIFLTARNDEESLTKGFELGAVDYITKPFRGAELRMRVQNHLQLRFTQRQLQEANAAKDKFFSIIAHDLRSPFTALVGMSQYLATGIDKLDAETAKEFLEGMHKSSKNAFNLLENLLEWSRIQTGRILISPKEIDISQIVQENLVLFEVNIENKELQIENHLMPTEPAYADENSVNTIVRNLLSNAIKFTPRGGRISLHSHRTDTDVVVTVQDNGVGIDPEVLPELFRIDIRHLNMGTENEKGSGLGLVLCREFVEKNGGQIVAESEPGQGALFMFTLPLKQ
ncbi:MAG: hybrid sensor histidine kinase/response regulator [Spirochaetaceae bacterium]|nr:hybrid sensor histidine kinase/response regulator [Spirochaetaceae bacterium]MCF7949428.1 hybrid sensor histidine kinase/response regulator [Spirochaetia bacterium]MCF7951363.1 hybrid sensor histidine kinase/response regulator [Spirochaetaceae bacterium]